MYIDIYIYKEREMNIIFTPYISLISVHNRFQFIVRYPNLYLIFQVQNFILIVQKTPVFIGSKKNKKKIQKTYLLFVKYS